MVKKMRSFSGYFFKRLILITVIFSCLILSKSSVYSKPFSRSKQTIVIDPGHGGSDSGAKGADNTLEKEITLLLAKKIKSRLEKKYTVILTRSDDYWVGNRQRTEIANKANPRLFISIHTNAGFIRETNGISFIFFKPPCGLPETSKSSSAETHPEKWSLTQKKFIPLSRLFAKALSKRFSNTYRDIPSRLNSLPLSVLSGANMPAILIELGYLTNPSEEKRLNHSDFLSDYSKEICSEIDFFLKKHKNAY